MRHRGRMLGLHEQRQLATVKALFVEVRGVQDVMLRELEIAALPAVEWRGRTLYRIRCQGDFGRGPHDMNVPESLLWNLLDLGWYRCPFHS